MNKEELSEILDKNDLVIREKVLLKIITNNNISKNNDELSLNDGYEFQVDGSVPEMADGIAKLAAQLEPNGFGEKAGDYFITLINDFYQKLKEGK